MSNLIYPVRLDRYVAIKSATKPDEKVLKGWLKCVKEFAPQGVVMTSYNVNEDGKVSPVAMVGERSKKGFSYKIPLIRALSEDEVAKIEDSFSANYPDFKHMIVTDETVEKKVTKQAADKSEYAGLCNAWAKHQHNVWMKDRLDKGWRLGPVNMKSKTHPLLKSWEELPEKHRRSDFTNPKLFLDLLSDSGYALVSKDEFAALRNIVRSL